MFKILRAFFFLGLCSFSFVSVVSNVSAVDTKTDTLNVSVPISCSLSATGTTSHNATISPGVYYDNDGNGIGLSTITTFCNDASGFAIYAIGFSGDTYGNNSLVANTVGIENYIPTGVYTVGDTTSKWSMRVSKVTDTSQAYIPNNLTITNSFDSWHTVPDTYTKVANYTSSTDTTLGSKITSTYAAFISANQPADTYRGQVKYALVHPASAPPQAVCNPDGATIADITCMQDVNSANKTSIMSSMTLNKQYSLIDFRDMKSYYVVKLADGNIWMAQNLDHDISSTYDYNSTNTDVPYASGEVTLNDTYETGDTTWEYSRSKGESYDPGDLCWNGDFDFAGSTVPCTQNGNHHDKNGNHYHLGNYYNWAAAIAVEINSGTTGRDVDQSICPAGWMLPKGGSSLTSSGSFTYLVNQLSLTAGDNGNIHQAPVYFAYSGEYYGDGISSLGEFGQYWSSVNRTSNGSYSLNFFSQGDIYPATNINGTSNLEKGLTVRCIVR